MLTAIAIEWGKSTRVGDFPAIELAQLRQQAISVTGLWCLPRDRLEQVFLVAPQRRVAKAMRQIRMSRAMRSVSQAMCS